MMSNCGSALKAALILAAGACAVSANVASAQFSSKNWVYAQYVNSLADGSVLTEYAGDTQESSNPDIGFRIGFLPRFGCAPLISLFSDVPIISDGVGGQLLGTFHVPEFSIDQIPISFPSLSEGVDGKIVIYYNANAARRTKLRLQVAEGVGASMKLSNGQELSFSLLGSNAVLKHAEDQCRQHVPGN